MGEGAAYDGDDPTCLVGEQLNMVCFVMDYVEFGFNGPILRSLAPPDIAVDGARWAFPSEGARDALCKLIGVEIVAVSVSESQIALTNRDGARLRIPLNAPHNLDRKRHTTCPPDLTARYVWWT